MTNQEQIKDLLTRKDALKKFLDIEKTAAWIAEEEKKTEAPDFWNDPKEAQKVVKGINAKKTWVNAYKDVDTACGDLEVMGEFFESGDATEEELLAQIAVTQKKVEELNKQLETSKEAPVAKAAESAILNDLDDGIEFTDSNDGEKDQMSLFK